MQKLLLGTGNAKKADFYRRFLADLPYKVVTAREAGIEEAEEIADTIEGNAELKARYYFAQSHLVTLADDAGFEIPALDNFPGTKARRFAGQEATDEDVIAQILKAMQGLRGQQRRARMKVTIALQLAADKQFTASGAIDGTVPEQPYEKRMPHFPYRSLLYIDALHKWFYDLTDEDEEKLGYRAKAIKDLMKYLYKK